VADHSVQDLLDNVILVSRKRQAHIATELSAHQKDVHDEEGDQSSEVAKQHRHSVRKNGGAPTTALVRSAC
jgi:hypothetical protein